MIDVEAGKKYVGSAHLKDVNPDTWGSGGGAGATSTPPASAPMLLDVEAWRAGDPSNKVAWLPGAANNYIEIPDVNLLDTRQASFDNVGFAGTIQPDDRYEIWGSGGGTGAGALGSASPFMVDLEKLKTDDRHLFLPGKSGNYGSISDVNLLDADTAHLVQGVGQWQITADSSLSTERSLFGGQSLRTVAPSGGGNSTLTLGDSGTAAIKVTPNTQYTFSVDYFTEVAKDARVYINRYDAAGTYLGQVAFSLQALAAGAWTRYSETWTTAGTDEYVQFLVRLNSADASQVWFVDRACLRAGTDVTFVPSVHTMSGMDVRVEVDMPYRPAASNVLVGRWKGGSARTGAWALFLTAAGHLQLAISDNADTAQFVNSSVPVSSTAGKKEFRFTVVPSTGVVRFFVDGAQLGTDQAGPIHSPDVFDMDFGIGSSGDGGVVGANALDGRVYSASIRDGIDGPVVASYDFENASRGATSLTTPEGHTLTVNQATVLGAGRAEIRGGKPTKAGWLPGTTGNYFRVADRNVLDADTAHLKQSLGKWANGGGVLSRAVAAWRAEDVKGQYLRDLTGNGHDARFGSAGAARVMGPLHGKDGYLRLPGVSGNYASSPDHADLDITADIDVRVELSRSNYTPAVQEFLAAKDNVVAGGRSWNFALTTAGALRVEFFPAGDGSVYRSAEGPFSSLVTAGARVWARFTLDADDGAGTWNLRFYYSTDGQTWTETASRTGTYATAARGMAAGNAPLSVGSRAANNYLTGRMYRAIVKNGIDGTTVFDADFTNRADGATSFTEATGKTVTINSSGGADTNDPKLLEYAGEQYLYLPGASGNYASIPDVNLLEANDAHTHQSKGSWVQNSGAAAPVRDTADTEFGSASLKHYSNAGANVQNETRPLNGYPVTAGQQYTFSFRGKGIATGTAMNAQIVWYDSTGTYISASGGASVTPSTTAWQTVSATATAPTGATHAVMRISGSGFPNSVEAFRTSRHVFRAGSSTSFVPSHRVVFDIDIRARVALDDWTPGTINTLISKYLTGTNQRAYRLDVNTSGGLTLYWSPDGTATLSASSGGPVPVADGAVIHVRATLDVDNGSDGYTVRFYTSTDGTTWTELGAAVTAAGVTNLTPSSPAAVTVSGIDNGTNLQMAGKVFSWSVRDGIDGVVVASADFTDTAAVAEPFQTATTPEGHTLTINRSASGRKSAVVDRTLLLFGTDDYLEVADHPDLDFGAADDFTIAVLYRSHTTGAYQTVLAKKNTMGATDPGYLLQHSQDTNNYTDIADGTNRSYDAQAKAAVGTLGSVVMVRRAAANNLETYVNGTSGGASTDATGDLSNSYPLRIGNWSGTATGYLDAEFVAAAVVRGALTADEIVRLSDELKNQRQTLSRAAASAAFGGQKTVSSTGYVTAQPALVAATAGATYGASTRVLSGTLAVTLAFYDANRKPIGGATSSASASPSVTAVAPTGTAFVSVGLSGTGEFGETALRSDGATAFVPSHRVVNDIDLRAKLSLKDLSGHAADHRIIEKGYGGCYWFTVTPGGNLYFAFRGDAGVTRAVMASSPLPADFKRTVKWVRVTRVASTGDYVLYSSPDGRTWTALQSGGVSPGEQIRSLTYDIGFGVTSGGQPSVLQHAEVRDGIDGPIVARFDADDPGGFAAGAAHGASYVDVTTGHSVVLSASGDATTEIVDRNAWMFAGAANEHLEVPDRDDLDFAAGTEFEIAARVAMRSNSSARTILSKKVSDITSPGYQFTIVAPQRVFGRAIQSGGPDNYVVPGSGDTAISQGKAIFFRRTATTLATFSGNTLVAEVTRTNYDIRSPEPLRIGTFGSSSEDFAGQIAWTAIFRRALTTTERNALAAWDGKVTTEPVWLRPLAVFYINADDPLCRLSYENNEVLNLGSAEYGELGWQVAKHEDFSTDGASAPAGVSATLSRGSGVLAPVVGSMLLRVDLNGAGSWRTTIASDPVGPITPGQTYSASVSVSTITTGGYQPVQAEIVWYDSAGGEVGRTGYGATVQAHDDAWQRVSASGVAPTGAAEASLEVRMRGDASWIFYLDAAIIRQGADAGYVPSLRVREDLDVRVHLVPKAWSDGVEPVILSKYHNGVGDGGWYARLASADRTKLAWTSDGSTYTEALANAGQSQVNRRPGWLRWMLDADNGASGRTTTFQESSDGEAWTTYGTDTDPGTVELYPSTQPLMVGARNGGGVGNMLAGFLAAEIRDGIDGPVLLDLDVANWPDDSDTYTMPNGLEARIVRSGDATAEIVDRPTLGLSGTESLALPVRAALKPVDTFTVAAQVFRRTITDRAIARGVDGDGYGSSWRLTTAGPRVTFTDGSASAANNLLTGQKDGLIAEAAPGEAIRNTRMSDGNSVLGTVRSGTIVYGAPAYMAIGLTNGVPNLAGFMDWYLFINGSVLTDAQRTELVAWDGTVANEPAWLRDAATFYWNADDDTARARYISSNEVLNLADSASNSDAVIRMEWFDADSTLIRTDTSRTFTTEKGAWIRPELAATAPPDATQLRMNVLLLDAGVGHEFHVDAAMVELGDAAGPYFDGATFGADWIWAGTPDASVSRYYPGRTERNVRLMELLPEFLPLNQDFIITYQE